MADRIEIGRRYHCRELNTTKHRTGIFSCDENDIQVRLFDYEEFFHLDDAPLFLQLEDNLIVSMHNIVPKGSGRSIYLHEPSTTTYFAGAWANTLVVGHRQWAASDLIRTVRFSVPQTKELLSHQPRLKMMRAKRFPSAAASTPLFEVVAAGLTVRCWYTISGSWDFGTSDWEPRYEIEFAEAQTLQTYMNSVHVVLQFLSATAGFQLVPAKIAISPLTRAESMAAIDKRKDDDFSIEYIWSEAVVDKSDLHIRNSFAMASDRLELAAFKSCLRAWLVRNEQWEKATTLMMGSLGLVRETSGRRLLVACRWLEAVPDNAVEPAVNKSDIDHIIAEATKASHALGHFTLDQRIRGALRSIGKEANRDRFVRLLSEIRATFGETALHDEEMRQGTIEALMQALSYRGQEAHSFVGEDTADIRPLYVALTAMEAFCYLLMIKDLPMSEAGRQRALFSRVVRAYQYARMDVGSVNDGK